MKFSYIPFIQYQDAEKAINEALRELQANNICFATSILQQYVDGKDLLFQIESCIRFANERLQKSE